MESLASSKAWLLHALWQLLNLTADVVLQSSPDSKKKYHVGRHEHRIVDGGDAKLSEPHMHLRAAYKGRSCYKNVAPVVIKTLAQCTWAGEKRLSHIVLKLAWGIWGDVMKRDYLLMPSEWFPDKGTLLPELKGMCRCRCHSSGGSHFKFDFPGDRTQREQGDRTRAVFARDRIAWLKKWLPRFRKAQAVHGGVFLYLEL